MSTFPIIWLTGNSGAGKTTLAEGMKEYFNGDALCRPFVANVLCHGEVLSKQSGESHESMHKTFAPQDDTMHPLFRRILILDGDEMRATVSVDEGFSREDRRRHNLRVARLAKLFQSHGFLVIVAVIAPFQSVRDELTEICDPLWVYVKRSNLEADDHPYEAPEHPAIVVDNDEVGIEEGREMLKGFIEEKVRGKVALGSVSINLSPPPPPSLLPV
ncbi:hypothetical protein COU77_03490 [Candidatus Peregrinibacteria bacterium CG10_big_fil_rev_8_21_14_0_10_49_16]|nr:MAG: hypothetical protein COU77_03490 [Candidatus Peregrinibacteria bacterium CG10_big_fil_rev_8_21_14_0_10_49_16]